MLTGSGLMMLGVFAKPLGIPSGFDTVPTLAAIVFVYLGYRASKKAKVAGELSAWSDAQRRKRFGAMVVACAVACIAMPLVFPFTGLTLPFGQLVAVSTVSFIICIGALWWGMKTRT